MKFSLLEIIENFKEIINNQDADLAFKTDKLLLKVQPIERYYLIKGFKLADVDNFRKYSKLCIKGAPRGRNGLESMIVLLDEIYCKDLDDNMRNAAYNGMVQLKYIQIK